MTKRQRKSAARPIKTKRDFEGATAVVKRISGETARTSAAEARLQLLLRELDKFDDTEDETAENPPDEYRYAGPLRRWSDDGSESE